MRFEWDEEKNRQNFKKHDIRFETAALVFEDPYAITQRDSFGGEEERWITLGAIAPSTVLFVVHTWFETEGQFTVRIISARAATPRERRTYEETHQGTKTRHRRDRGKKRRRY